MLVRMDSTGGFKRTVDAWTGPCVKHTPHLHMCLQIANSNFVAMCSPGSNKKIEKRMAGMAVFLKILQWDNCWYFKIKLAKLKCCQKSQNMGLVRKNVWLKS